MTEKHKVRFEPVGIEIDVDEDQTILRAAAEQGIMLMHGCKEGQCASCKSFILEGEDIEHDKYSTFALPDYEKEEGYTLLCRAHAYEDVTIELLNYDEDMIRSGLPIQQAVAEVVSKDPVTHDMRHLVLRLIAPDEVKFFPASTWTSACRAPTRSGRSRWRTPQAGSGLLEFVIKVYPDGLFSRFLDEELQVGDRLELTGPFGVFTLRESDVELVFVGGGAGMAPILSLLRSMAERGIHRKATFFYGARGAARPLLRGRAGRDRGEAAELLLRPGSLARGLGRRERPYHRCRQAPDQRPRRRARLRLRPAAHGGGRDPAARDARRPGKAGLLRQVHDNRRANMNSPFLPSGPSVSTPEPRKGEFK